jgi:FdhD protein
MQASTDPLTTQVPVRRIAGPYSTRFTDTVAVEEPLEIRLQYWFKDAQFTMSLALTMRTPGNDRELATGFLYSEGIVTRRSEITDMRALGGENSNEILIELSKQVDFEVWRASRATYVNSSCGVCGKRSVDALTTDSQIETSDGFSVSAAMVHELPGILNTMQTGFAETGGLHAAMLVNVNGSMQVKAVYEDIGRHNALDKLIGSQVLAESVPLSRQLLLLSSRSSFELVQKAACAGIPILATIGSPSSLAIEAAQRCNLTLIGFVRDERFNVYTGDWRIHS